MLSHLAAATNYAPQKRERERETEAGRVKRGGGSNGTWTRNELIPGIIIA